MTMPMEDFNEKIIKRNRKDKFLRSDHYTSDDILKLYNATERTVNLLVDGQGCPTTYDDEDQEEQGDEEENDRYSHDDDENDSFQDGYFRDDNTFASRPDGPATSTRCLLIERHTTVIETNYLVIREPIVVPRYVQITHDFVEELSDEAPDEHGEPDIW